MITQMYMRGMTKYPHDKNTAGPIFWGTMHDVASKLKPHIDDTLTQEEIHTFHQWLLYTAAHFVCDSCDATPWIKTHEITGNTRRDMERYVCRMHNWVNEKTGKTLTDCSTIHSEGKCNSCEYIQNEEVPMHHDTPPSPLAPSINNLNKSRREIFEALCKREGIPVPVIKYGKCPGPPYGSCVVPNEDVSRSEVYLDPDPLRSIAHEFNHYLKRYKGDIAGAYNEYQIDMDAQALADKEFPKTESNPTNAVLAMHDTPQVVPADANVQHPDRMESVLKRFPMYAKRLKESEQSNRHSHSTAYQSNSEMERDSRGSGTGFLSGLDGVFRPLADMIGIPAHTATTMHMSNTIGQVVNMVVATTTSPLGASIVSFFGAMILFAIGTFSRGDIGQEDRKILFGIISTMFNNNIALLGNARTRESIMSAANMAGYAMSRLDFDMLFKTLTLSPAQLSAVVAHSGEGGFAPGGSNIQLNQTGGSIGGTYGTAPSGSSPGGFNMPVPAGGGVDTRFQTEGPLRNQQGQTFDQAVARRRPSYAQNYSPPLGSPPPGYGGSDLPELSTENYSDFEDTMNVTNGGIDSLPDIDFGLRGGMQQQPNRRTYEFEEDFGF